MSDRYTGARALPDDRKTHGGYAVLAIPTWRDYLRNWLGYRRHFADLPPEAEALPGWFKTVVHVKFDWWDRVRLLACGRVDIDIESRCTPAVDRVLNAATIVMISPFDREPVR